jgi:hypothetical protein
VYVHAMSSWPTRLVRRIRFGEPIVVVSGLPRSGTSMAMKMLGAGGIRLLTDGERVADESNPEGYYELERVKDLDKPIDQSWLVEARGGAVKIISFLLTYLPDAHNYKIIFMNRRLPEVVASQNKMLAARGEGGGSAAERDLLQMYETHLRRVRSFLRSRSCFEVLDVDYAAVVASGRGEAGRMAAFLGRSMDVDRMASVIDSRLYRNRTESKNRRIEELRVKN